MSKHLWSIAFLGLIFIAFSGRPAEAQVLFGSIVGNVTDSSGAAVPDATVKVTQRETNESREVKTNETGGFVLSTLPAGTYDITIAKDRIPQLHIQECPGKPQLHGPRGCRVAGWYAIGQRYGVDGGRAAAD